MTKTISAGALLLVVAGIIFSNYSGLNYTVFNAINQALPLSVFWLTITNTGDVLFAGCLLFIVLRNNMRLQTNLLICAVLTHYIVKYSKRFFAELRPEHVDNLPALITHGAAINITNYAMPSGHTATAFIAALFIAQAYRITGWKLWVIFSYAAFVGISRIAVGAHWPSDVLVGAGLGILIARVFTMRKLHIDNRVVVYLTYALYLPFFVFAIRRIHFIDSPTTMITEGIFVLAGLVALLIWVRKLKNTITTGCY